MTYLQLVNEVLARLREPLTTSVLRNEDEVVNMVKALVNDAKRHVEMAHQWNATRNLWLLSTEVGRPSYILDETSGGCRISRVTVNGVTAHQWDMKTFLRPVGGTGSSYRFAIDGTDQDGNISLRLDPIPDSVHDVEVLGWRVLPDLSEDDDKLRLPDQPVLYYALALAARERGEVGGQTATELFGMAQQYIRDAIALDASLSPTETVWMEA